MCKCPVGAQSRAWESEDGDIRRLCWNLLPDFRASGLAETLEIQCLLPPLFFLTDEEIENQREEVTALQLELGQACAH